MCGVAQRTARAAHRQRQRAPHGLHRRNRVPQRERRHRRLHRQRSGLQRVAAVAVADRGVPFCELRLTVDQRFRREDESCLDGRHCRRVDHGGARRRRRLRRLRRRRQRRRGDCGGGGEGGDGGGPRGGGRRCVEARGAGVSQPEDREGESLHVECRHVPVLWRDAERADQRRRGPLEACAVSEARPIAYDPT